MLDENKIHDFQLLVCYSFNISTHKIYIFLINSLILFFSLDFTLIEKPSLSNILASGFPYTFCILSMSSCDSILSDYVYKGVHN